MHAESLVDKVVIYRKKCVKNSFTIFYNYFHLNAALNTTPNRLMRGWFRLGSRQVGINIHWLAQQDMRLWLIALPFVIIIY